MNLQASADTASRRTSQAIMDFVNAALQVGDSAEAERLLHERLAKAPADAAALAKLAEIAIARGRIEDATILLRRAADGEPTLARHVQLLTHLQNNVGPAAALKVIDGLGPQLRMSYPVRAIEAAASGTLGLHERQIAIYESLARVTPDDAMLWKTLGDALKTVGRLDEAVAALRKAIRIRPTYGEAYWTLANFKAFRFTDKDISAMRAALKKKLGDADALHFHFALGEALEKRGLYQQSFRHYAAGNNIRAKSINPADMFVTGFVDAAVASFTADVFEQRGGAGFEAADPIFVVGLQRSGSTLIEQILASHPMVEGTTEIAVMPQLWARVGHLAAGAEGRTFDELRRLDSDSLRALGEEYLRRTRPFRNTDRPRFVDKLPANWMNLALIRLCLPNAKIIDARRHPMACGFSNFKQHYATGVLFAYSQESIGAFYRDYWRFMRHVDEVQPGAVHRVINEKLIDDPEGEIRRMLDCLGLPFDPACLEFHANRRAVRTPSAEQVRRPINREGVDHWKHYEPWLSALKAALGPALDAWDQ